MVKNKKITLIKPQNKVRTLLMGSDTSELEIISDLIEEVTACSFDVMQISSGSNHFLVQNQYDLIVWDVTGLSLYQSLEGVEKIKSKASSSAIIVIDQSPSIDQAVTLTKLGVEDYLQKPFNLDAFKFAVKRALSKKASYSKLDSQGSSSLLLRLLNACQVISASFDSEKAFRALQSFLSFELGDVKPTLSAIYVWQDDVYIKITSSDIESNADELLEITVQQFNPHVKFKNNEKLSDSFLFTERNALSPKLFIFKFLEVGGKEYYFLSLSPKKPNAFEEFQVCIRMLRAQMQLTLNSIEQFEGVQKLVFLDDTTGLYNSRYLNTVLDKQIADYEIQQKPFAMLFMDVDYFKQINDTHGHTVGTKVLNEVARELKKYIRSHDTVFRYGGDEFIAILSHCDLPTAKFVAERIRVAIENTLFAEDEGLALKITLSIGVALYPEHAATKRAIIEAADQAMYGAKKSSRNSVFIATNP